MDVSNLDMTGKANFESSLFVAASVDRFGLDVLIAKEEDCDNFRIIPKYK
jgi:hypothetical protein